jgi:PmbA protein
MDSSDAQALLDDILTRAKAAGAQSADAVLYHAVASSVSWRMGALEDVERSEGADLGLRILIGQRQAIVSTTDLSRASLSALIERCAAMAKAAPEDPYVGLAPADRLARAPFAIGGAGAGRIGDARNGERGGLALRRAAFQFRG